jgi:hypothetical protein
MFKRTPIDSVSGVCQSTGTPYANEERDVFCIVHPRTRCQSCKENQDKTLDVCDHGQTDVRDYLTPRR